MGGYFGGKLQRVGHEVGFIARGTTLQALRQRGLDIGGPAVRPAGAAESAAQLMAEMGVPEIVVVASKALPGNATFGDLPQLAELDGVPVVTTQNSVETHYEAAELFGEECVFAAVVRAYLTRTGPAEVRLNPGPLSLNFGPLPGVRAAHLDVVGRFHAALHEAGIDSDFLPDGDIMVDVWSKAMFVATTGALGALAGREMGVLRTELRPQLRGLMEEVAAAGRGRGVKLPADLVDRTLDFADAQYAEATSSMHRDIEAGAPNELDAQVGAIRRMAADAGVGTPLLDFTHAVLEARGRH